MMVFPSLPIPMSRVPMSPNSGSYMQNLSPFESWWRSIISTWISDILSMVMTSTLLADSPGCKLVIGSNTNGFSCVPAPDKNAGEDVVFSGSGPSANIRRILSLPNRSGISNKSKRIIRHGKHHIQLDPSLSSSSSSSSSFATSSVMVREKSNDSLWTELLAQIVKLVISISSVGVPRILPSSAASRAGLQPKVSPSGKSPLISQVATPPRPVKLGSNGVILSPTVSCRLLVE